MFFSRITDKRFKANQISLNFYTDFDETPRADFAAASYILTDSCAKFPHYKDLSRRLSNLYNASLTCNTSFSQWEQRCVSISLSVLDNSYALGGENLEEEMCELAVECILRPNAKDGAFDETVTALMKAELIDDIDGIINDKATYAMRRAAQTAFRGEPMEQSVLGTHNEAQQVTPQSAYAAYVKLLETSRVEIFASGCSEFADARRIFSDMFSGISRHNICELTTRPSPLKPSPEYVKDSLKMQQAIVRMYFKSPKCEDKEARGLLSMILGGMATSRFFMNIRERQSLCYYCSCISHKYKRTLTAYAGVEPSNIEKCQKAILAEFRDICENSVSEDELKTAKLEFSNRISAVYDSAGAMISWYLNQLTDEEILTPEEYYERIAAVTPERIKAAAKMFSLDTVYTLSGGEAAL